MSTESGKRPLPSKVARMKTRKRQKVAGGKNGMAQRTIMTAGAEPRNISLEELEWKPVAILKHLDDYEGFFGLEEIEDVEVVKDGGHVSYRTGSKVKDETKASSRKDQSRVSEKLEDFDGRASIEREDWDGFEDEVSKAAPSSNLRILPISQKAKKPPKPRKSSNLPSAPVCRTAFSTGTFAGLQEETGEDGVDISAWSSMKLSSSSLSSLSKLGFDHPTPIQSSAIPSIMDGHDMIGKAPTGSGKTLAFGLPIFEHWLEERQLQKTSQTGGKPHPIALIILPTRELAHQITDHLKALSSDTDAGSPLIATLTGGLSIHKQRRLLVDADIVVATPGRLWEVIEEAQETLDSLTQIQFLVVDEADRLLSAGHFKELELILGAIDQEVVEEDNQSPNSEKPKPKHRQTLVFSATFHKGLQQKLAKRTKYSNVGSLSNEDSMSYLLKKLNFREPQPIFVDVNPISQMATGLREGLIECPRGVEKDLYLYALIMLYYAETRTLVFVNSISAVRRIVPFLQNLNLVVFGLHSQMPQKARMRSVERFTASQNGGILVATDVAARGLDIREVALVVHYHLPRAADTYVHRSGRTARASQTGSSILICAPEEVAGVRRLLAQIHANASGVEQKAKSALIQSIDIDKRIVARLKPRVILSKKLADSSLAKEKRGAEDDWLRKGAEELGVDYSSDEFERMGARSTRGRRGGGRMQKEKEARALTKAEAQATRFELKRLLDEKVNVGISVRYLTANNALDIDELLARQGKHAILGNVPALGLEE